MGPPWSLGVHRDEAEAAAELASKIADYTEPGRADAVTCPACHGTGDAAGISHERMWAPCSLCRGTGELTARSPEWADAVAELRTAYSSTVRAHVEAAHARDRYWWQAWGLMWAAIGLLGFGWRTGYACGYSDCRHGIDYDPSEPAPADLFADD